ncbi:MAG: UDP-N-acetylmuramoyl-L-alanyl-D-glutamate--2,6-diaminopimelate ligase, partial [Betaproteobacteria bacterium]
MIQRLSSDSRRCAPGVAFFAYPGETADGRAHIPDAISRGASAVLWEEQGFSWRSE